MELGMELQQQQQLRMTPQLQQALRLLQLSTIEFNQEIEAALSSNPFLETTLEPSSPIAAVQAPNGAEGPQGEASPQDPPPETEHEAAAWSHGSNGDGEGSDDWSEPPASLHEQLRLQLLVWPLSDRERVLAHLLIDELSDAGYLETSLDELLDLIPAENGVTLAELEAVLGIVQQLEPTGVGARSLQECLLLQLEELPHDTPGVALARCLIVDQLDLLARRQFSRLSQILGCDDTALHTARALIRSLDPRPGRQLAEDNTRYIVPDVIVTQSGKRWLVRPNVDAHPTIRLNRRYAELAARRRDAPACSQMLQEARWLLRNIEQRRDTIQRVATAIVSRQRTFFSYGDAAMRPMALRDIAGELGLHESTVCRVTNGKYMATPRGLFEFKYFFSRQLPARGGNCSALAIRALIKELIAAENPEQPLSDVQLAHLLNAQGFGLVRRTVTKYRSQMRVPSVELRRVSHR